MNRDQIKNILNSLSVCTDEMIREIRAYSSSFDRTALLKMTSDESDIKAAHKSYRRLTSKIIRLKDKADMLTSGIANILCCADMEMDNDTTALLSDILDSYLEWSSAVLSFLRSSDRLFTKNNPDFRLSVAISYATSFINATEKLKGTLTNEKLYSCS